MTLCGTKNKTMADNWKTRFQRVFGCPSLAWNWMTTSIKSSAPSFSLLQLEEKATKRSIISNYQAAHWNWLDLLMVASFQSSTLGKIGRERAGKPVTESEKKKEGKRENRKFKVDDDESGACWRLWPRWWSSCGERERDLNESISLFRLVCVWQLYSSIMVGMKELFKLFKVAEKYTLLLGYVQNGGRAVPATKR